MNAKRFVLIGCCFAAGVLTLPNLLFAAQDTGQGKSTPENIGQQIKGRMFDGVWESGDNLPSLGESSLQVAQASGDDAAMEEPMPEECLKFGQDIDADVGAIIKAGCKPTQAQMAKLMDNPLGSVAMWFNQLDFYRMTNESVTDETKNKTNYMSLFQFPKRLNDDWNLINRFVINVSSMPLNQDKIDAANAAAGDYSDITGVAQPPATGPALPINQFDGRTTALGDIYYVGLFSKRDPIVVREATADQGRAIAVWGLGFDLGVPSATEDLTGTGKWTAGPSALGVYMGPKWKIGALLQQYWDFAGDSDRDPVNLTNLQYFIFYGLSPTLSIGAAPNIIGNWEQDKDDRWTVPIGLGIQKVIKLGKASARIGFEAHYSVIQPDNVPSSEWDFRFYFIPAAPSVLFDWMN